MGYAVRVLRLLGCDTLVVTNAAGGVNLDFQAGDLMLITDHIKIFMESPLRGESPAFGPRFPDASPPLYPRPAGGGPDRRQGSGYPAAGGRVYVLPGPQYETPAEVRFAQVAGADAVGMSTAPEVIVAGHCGMQVLGFTLVSNLAAGILDQPLSEQEVLDAARPARISFPGWCWPAWSASDRGGMRVWQP